jgi:hypothetical protein
MQHQWITTFNEAAGRIMARRESAVPQLEAYPCPDHGEQCVCIQGGDLILKHSLWQEVDPAQLADDLLTPLLAKLQATKPYSVPFLTSSLELDGNPEQGRGRRPR